MGKELAKELPIIGGTTNEIVLYQPDDKMTLEVKLNNETVWLSLNLDVTNLLFHGILGLYFKKES